MFWISYSFDRRSSELLDTDCEHFVAPNSVVGLTTVVYPSGSMTEQLPTTQVAHTPPPPSGRRPDGGGGVKGKRGDVL